MTNLIVAFPKLEDARSIRNILVKCGFPVAAVCTSGAQALQYADDLHNGIVVCGYRMTDMIYSRLREDLPEQFDLLLLASNRYLEEIEPAGGLVCVAMPLKVHELKETVSRMIEASERRKRRQRLQPRERTTPDRALIGEAKQLLMEKKQMTEEEAHRYLQKRSMDNGVNMLETAKMVLSIMKN
ncbi:MAG: ANTAR domain-containing protein [Lachnospiraceae bacterium]|nr:ANTAR domain-containing protein [Lachnospiraceae bacterium]